MVGYIWIDEHTQISILQHRFIMEQKIGRPLSPSEDVHHINGDKTDNHISNLRLINHGEHSTLTGKNRKMKTGYKMNLSDKERLARSMKMKAYHQKKKILAAIDGAKSD
jgi:hypothetical protein